MELTGNILQVVRRSDEAIRDWLCRIAYANGFQMQTVGSSITSNQAVNAYVLFRANSLTTVAKIQCAAAPYFEIPLAGDITFLANKMASLQLVEVQGSRGAAGFIDGAGGKRATFNEGICISII